MTVLDSGTPDPGRVSGLGALGVTVVLGACANTAPADHYDLCVVSPGIDPKEPLFRSFLARSTSLIG